MTKFQQGRFSEATGRTEDARETWSRLYERFYVVVIDARGFAKQIARTDKLLLTDFGLCEFETEADAIAAMKAIELDPQEREAFPLAVQRLVIVKARALPMAYFRKGNE